MRILTKLLKTNNLTKTQEEVDLPRDEIKSNTVIIIGAGIIGLANLAYQIYLLQTQISSSPSDLRFILIDKRPFKFERTQKLIVNQNKHFADIDTVNWKEFCLKLFNPTGLYHVINDQLLYDETTKTDLDRREEFLLKMLRQPADERVTSFSIKSLQEALFEFIQKRTADIKIEFFEEAKVVDLIINKTGESTLKIIPKNNEKTMSRSFKMLIDCEGANRELLINLINPALKKADQRPFVQEKFVELQGEFAIVRLKFKEITKIENGKYENFVELFDQRIIKTDLKAQQRKDILEKFESELGLTNPQIPEMALNTNFRPEFTKKRPIFSVTIPVPEEIRQLPELEKTDAIIKYAIYTTSIYYGFPHDYFEFDNHSGDQSEKFRLSTFELSDPGLQYLDSILRVCGETIIQISGDAAMSPYFKTGLSAMLGLNLILAFNPSSLDKSELEDQLSNLTRLYNLFQRKQANDIASALKGKIFQYERIYSVTNKETDNFYLAVKARNIKLIENLLKNGISVNALYSSNETPLATAIQLNDLKIAKLLLKNGANPNLEPSPIVIAFQQKNLEAVSLLFKYGARVPKDMIIECIRPTIEYSISHQNFDMLNKLIIEEKFSASEYTEVIDMGNFKDNNGKLLSFNGNELKRQIVQLINLKNDIEIFSVELKSIEKNTIFYPILKRMNLILDLDLVMTEIKKDFRSHYKNEATLGKITAFQQQIDAIKEIDKLFAIAINYKLQHNYAVKICFNNGYEKISRNANINDIIQEMLGEIKTINDNHKINSPTLHLMHNSPNFDPLIKALESKVNPDPVTLRI